MQLKFAYLVKLLSKHQANLSSKNLTSNFEGWRLTLVAYKKRVPVYLYDALFLKYH